jgi:RNA polymerase sigma-70 factor (ECF subfamily)
MKKINLREYYPYYKSNCYIEVPDEVAKLLYDFQLREAAYRLRAYRYKAFYSLDRNDGIERDILFVALSPCEIYERKILYEELYTAITSLPEKQARRIHAYYFLNMSKTAIAKAEGISESAVRDCIKRGLRSMKKYMNKFR